MSFPRYPTYRASGHAILGEIPSAWEARPLRSIGRLLKGFGGSKEDIVEEGVPCVRYGDLYTTHGIFIERSRTQIAEDEAHNYASISRNDVLFAASGETFEDIGKSAVNLIDRPAYCGGDVIIFRPTEDLSGRFMGYACGSANAVMQKIPMGRGTTVKHIYPDELRHLTVALPPRHEQDAIAAFLDRETAKIDALIAEQEQLIERLLEKRQAVISHAVTMGLNPNVQMKDSGAKWLGDVPKHWWCGRNKVVFSEVDERSDSEDGELMTVSHITGVTPRSEKDVNMFLAETLQGYKRCQGGDLVINTMWAWMGALGCSPCSGLVSPSYNIYRPRKVGQLSPSYYDYLSRIPSHRIAIKANSTGIWESRLRLYPTAFLDMPVALPPYTEQCAIVEHLDQQTSRCDVLVAEARRAVDVLRERRSALISAAVTGQVDVRNA